MNYISFLILMLLFGSKGFAQSNKILSKPIPIEHINVEKWFFLKEALKDKKIVALGESLHGVKEYNAYKLQIIKFLHEELKFNVIAIESDLAMNYYGNLYRNQISDSIFLHHLFTPVWHTENHLKLVNYIKNHPDLKIIGFDIVDINSTESFLSDLSIEYKIDTVSDEKFVNHYSTIKKMYKNEETFLNGTRDSIMMANLRWIIEELYPNEKVIICAANDHVSKVSASKFAYMGQLLSSTYKNSYYSIGFFHSLGDPSHLFRNFYYSNDLNLLPENSLQKKMLSQKNDFIFVDLKNLKRKKKNQWVDSELKHVILTEKYEYTINLSQSFDAFIWIRKVTHPKYVIKSKFHTLDKN